MTKGRGKPFRPASAGATRARPAGSGATRTGSPDYVVRVSDGPRGRGVRGAVSRQDLRDGQGVSAPVPIGGPLETASAESTPRAGAAARSGSGVRLGTSVPSGAGVRSGAAGGSGTSPRRRSPSRPAYKAGGRGGIKAHDATSLSQLAPSDAQFVSKPLKTEDWGPSLGEWALLEGTELTEDQVTMLVSFASHILAWSRRMRLVGRAEPAWLLREQIAPSLLVLRGLEDQPLRYVDIGSGAGIPAIVCAVLRPAWSVTCVESVRKKCLFVTDSARDLGLEHFEVFRGRAELFAEDVAAPKEFDLASSRCVGRPAESLPLIAPLLRVGGLARVFVPRSEVETAEKDGTALGWELVESFGSALAPIVVQSWRKR